MGTRPRDRKQALAHPKPRREAAEINARAHDVDVTAVAASISSEELVAFSLRQTLYRYTCRSLPAILVKNSLNRNF